jgi:hypothetical protein
LRIVSGAPRICLVSSRADHPAQRMTGKMGLLKTTALARLLQTLIQIIQHKIAIWQRRLAMTT